MFFSDLIVAFVVLTLIMSFVYFYMFSRRRERFIVYWGISWVAYSFSLLLLILYMSKKSIALLEVRKVFDMINILFLLFGAYAFMHLKIPTFWYRFALYVTIWLGFGVYASFDLISIYLPIGLYQVVATVMLCFLIYRYWKVPSLEKAISICVFLFWGVGKAAISVFEASYYNTTSLYLLEIISSNILNFCIFIIYLQKAGEEISLAEKLYKTIAENVTDVIFYYTLKPKPAFTYVTPSASEMLGYDPQEFYKDPRFYLNLVDPGEFQRAAEIFEGEHESGQEAILRMIHKSGAFFWGEIRTSVLRENGSPSAIEGTIRDVTVLKESERTLIENKQAREMFLSSISHELKTPITAIAGYANAWNDGTLKTEEEREYAARVIVSKARTMERLISDLTQLSQLETRRFSFDFSMMQASELARLLVDNHRLDIRTAGIRLSVSMDPELEVCSLIVDPKRIDQVFSNIVFNALKYTEKKGLITLTFRINGKNRRMEVDVSDTGKGIEEKDLPYIFDRFYKGAMPARKTAPPGSGLGLTISREIIQGHGGEIRVRSVPGKGSVFTFELPLYEEEIMGEPPNAEGKNSDR